MSEAHRLGCDIGGTFTDLVLLDARTGRFHLHKLLTTPDDPSEAVARGVRDLRERHPEFGSTTEHVIHGTTRVINAIVERTGAPTGLLTTRGFADILDMRRENRYDIYDIGAVYPTPLVPRPWRRELDERVLPDGSVERPLEEAPVREALRELVAAGVVSVAVCLLHAFRNPVHERLIGAIAREAYPDLAVSLSSDVMPEIREFERSSTTVFNAYVKPLTRPYIERLRDRLTEEGVGGGLYFMRSGGGVVTPAIALDFPIQLVESGPVGGALAAAHIARRVGFEDVVAFDMGGTTAKACVISEGRLPVVNEYEVDRVHRFKRGSGSPVHIPCLDIIETGAGGGSIAGFDRLGLLQVGPRSAGAQPGPICYSRGGQQPTVTDADLVLGYLDPDYFLGGRMRLDREAASAGIERHIGARLGLDPIRAARGIVEIVDENMAAAIRMHATERGHDLGRAVLVGCGGAGPVHADSVARKLGVARLLLPRGSGVFSALGFLIAPFSYQMSSSPLMSLEHWDEKAMGADLRTLEERTSAVVRDAMPEAEIRFERIADMRYAGQGSTVRVDLEGVSGMDDLAARFRAAYERLYGVAHEDLSAQVVTLRVTASAAGELGEVALPFSAGGTLGDALKGERLAYSPVADAMESYAVYDIDRLPAGARFDGPAIVEDPGSTLLIHAGASAEVDDHGWIDVTVQR